MSFPVPKDVRAPRPFEFVKGMDEIIRTPARISDPTQPLVPGEWMKSDAQAGAVKLGPADTIAAPAVGACVNWTLYTPGNSLTGQSDVLATLEADLVTGPFQARTIYFDPTANFQPGWPLVAIYDATNNRGILSPLDPDTATTRQLAAVVGKVKQPPTAGILWFECP